MEMSMKKILLLIAAVICTGQIFAQKVKVTKPLVKQSNSFAIVIDNVMTISLNCILESNNIRGK